MSTRTSARIALPLLLLMLGTVPACKGVPQPPQVDTAGLRIDALKARQKRGRVDVSVRIWNDFDDKVSFEHGNVRLMFGDREVSAKPARAWTRRNPSVQAKSSQDFRWVFVTGEALEKGASYTIELRDLMLDDVPAGDTAVFTINL